MGYVTGLEGEIITKMSYKMDNDIKEISEDINTMESYISALRNFLKYGYVEDKDKEKIQNEIRSQSAWIEGRKRLKGVMIEQTLNHKLWN